jgi:hypothetical protein
MYFPVGRRWFTGLRGLRLGAIGPPLAVAAALVAALVWFDKFWIPAQQQYLNERNLRALRTISEQIKAKVDNFDLAIDNALDSFEIQKGEIQKGNSELLQRYVKLFSPELEIVALFDPNRPPEGSVTAGDPPNVLIKRDEGRNYLYVGYLHQTAHREGQSPVALIARGDIERIAARLLTRSDFDALLLVDGKGATIAQHSSSGLEFANVDKLRDRGQDATSTTPPAAFDRMRGTTNMAIVTIGAADYVLYTQPVQLSLMHDDKQDKTGAPAAEEWALCGLLRLNRFRAASSAIPTTYWLWCGAALALVCFAIPLLKLRILSPRERLRRVDGVSVAAASFMMMALAAFTVLDLRVFGAIVPAAIDNRLQAVAASISTHVQQEAEAIARQMTAFEGEELWRRQMGYQREPHHTLPELREHLGPGKGGNVKFDEHERQWRCNPSWSCRSGVLPQLGEMDYPFFKMVMWDDDAGWQRVKWSTSPVITPFINVAYPKPSYFDELARARRLSSSDSSVPTSGVSVVLSPNTGEKLTLFWRALPPWGDVNHNSPPPDLIDEVLAATPVSLTRPVLPHNVQFAVVDSQGRVLFHSDSARSLVENFFQESEDSPKLRSLVAGRDSKATSARYLGRLCRFYVTPLDMTLAGDPSPLGDPRPFWNPGWSLVVFQDAAVVETANIQTINLALSMFAAYTLALGVTWALLGTLWPSALMKWLWPDPDKGPQYCYAAIVGAALGFVCLGARALLTPPMLVSAAAVLIVCATATMLLIVRVVPRSSRASATWPTDFFMARASVLFLLAVVPAVLCFHVAYDFHADLVVKRAQSRLASDLDDRARRIGTEAQGMAICRESDPGSQPCAKVGPIVKRRTMKTLWDVDIPVTEPREAAASSDKGVASTILQSFLMLAYRPYNDTAADLLMTSLSQPSQGLDMWRPTLGPDGKPVAFTPPEVATQSRFAPEVAPKSPIDVAFWLIVLTLLGVAYALARYVFQPLFALDMKPRPSLTAAPEMADDTSLLVIGPPGSGRTERLRRNPRVRIFDVRSLTFVDDPMEVAPSSPVQISSAADHGPTIEEQRANWPESIYDATSQPNIVALDHLEYRFDDENFRGQMLECLESTIYGRGSTIWCSSVRDPMEILDALDPPAQDRCRWARLFEGFRHEYLGVRVDRPRANALELLLARRRDRLAPDVRTLIVSECEVAPELLTIGENLGCRLPVDVPVSAEAVLAEISRAAVRFYEAVWDGCSIDEKVALHQLAEEGLVNPNNPEAVSRLLGAGLVRRDPMFRVMNETFRQFVLGAASPQTISAWEREGVLVPWGTIATTGVTVAFGLAGLLLLTQEQLVDAWIRYVPTLAPSIPTVWKVLASAQKGRIDVTA